MIQDTFEELWNNLSAWPELVKAMRCALSEGDEAISGAEGQSRWGRLVDLCCQAAGGRPGLSQEVTLAWLMFYSAAHLLDRVQDDDPPDPWWADLGAGVALSASSGLYFSASLILNELHNDSVTHPIAGAMVQDFYHTFLKMVGGQYADLTLANLDLEHYWRIAESKSGSFFALACRAGARLAGADEPTIAAYSCFGNHLGLLVQIKDDLEELHGLTRGVSPAQQRNLERALPLVYALEVLPAEQRLRLRDRLGETSEKPDAADQLLNLLDQCGAGSYVLAEMERHKGLALQALAQAAPLSPAGEELAALVQSV